ncbi:hypothetical protein CRUP_014723 [Coryphaenoides rupestris]|nr:hypothetical protein CRUP_014723 [Coryphaenoides rupestris]
MPSSTIRRQMKNMVNNYSDAEKKVRESTSNDPWGPSSSLMSEIADLTYNVVAFSEIMSMIWRRLNDHGKNWRHVYKALTLLDYLVKTGSERVALQCKENIFAIQTLKDFQYVDRDGKDQGINVREKSKQLVVLLKDEERLKAESEEYGRSEGSPASYHGSTSPNAGSELEQARPQTSGEEELQLQLALAMSREAAEQEDRMRRGDDLRLQMALEESKKGGPGSAKLTKKKREPQSSLMDLMDVPEPAGARSDPWSAGGPGRGGGGVAATAAAPAADPWQSYGSTPKPSVPLDPWGTASSVPPMKSSDPWGTNLTPAPDPWGSASVRPKTSNAGSFDLFSASNGTSKEDFSEFDSLRSSASVPTGDGGMAVSSLPSYASLASSGSLDMFDPMPSSSLGGMHPTRKTPESFLGPNAALVNLDSLVTKPAQPAPIVNPFLAASGGASVPAPAAQANPFQVSQPAAPTLNQMRVSPMPSGFGALAADPQPLSSLGQPAITMVPLAGMASMGRAGPAMGGMGSMGGSMSMGQPLMASSLPPQAAGQPPGTTNPFLFCLTPCARVLTEAVVPMTAEPYYGRNDVAVAMMGLVAVAMVGLVGVARVGLVGVARAGLM